MASIRVHSHQSLHQPRRRGRDRAASVISVLALLVLILGGAWLVPSPDAASRSETKLTQR
jgi:hypothetical protein